MNIMVAMVTDFVNSVLSNGQTINIFTLYIMEKLFEQLSHSMFCMNITCLAVAMVIMLP